MMQHGLRNRPVGALTAAGLCLALLGALLQQTFGPFDWLKAPTVEAVGGYAAESLIGPDNFTNEPTWEFIFFPANTIGKAVFDPTAEIIYGVGNSGGTIYRCDAAGTFCDEEADWAAYSIGSFPLYSLALDEANNVLYAGSNEDPAVVYRCETSTDCDDSGDWTVSNSFNMFAGAERVQALIVADGVLFAGVQAFFNDTSIHRCETFTGCDDVADWADITPVSPGGGRIQNFTFDSVNGIIYSGYNDGGSGYILRCETADCDDSGDWVTALFTTDAVYALVVDEDNSVVYAGADETIYRCDFTATVCDADADWTVAFDLAGSISIFWEPTQGVLYSGAGGNLYRCETTTGCDENSDWSLADQNAGQNAFVQDLTNAVLHSVGNSAYRCELATGCGAVSELTAPEGVMYDNTNSRLFVADQENNRILIYDTTGGIVDGEAPVSVLGQDDFVSFACNQGGSADINTLCEPVGLDYDDSFDQLFVADTGNNRVLVYDVSTIDDGEDAIAVLGQPDFFESDCASETAAATLCSPRGVNRDTNNNRLYVADTDNNRVLVYDGSDGITNGEDAINVLGQIDFILNACNQGGSTTAGTLCTPSGLTYDGDADRLFVADNGNARVLAYQVTTITDDEPAVNVLGQPNFTTVSPETDADSLTSAYHVNYDGDNSRIFVSDPGSTRVMIWDVDGITDGEEAVDVVGQDDFTSSDTGESDGLMDGPAHIAIGDTDQVFIADQNNNRVLLFTIPPGGGGGGGSTAGHEATDVVGQLHGDDTITFDHAGVDNSPNSRGFSGPEGVTIDAVNHRLFEVDPANHRVMVFDLDTGNALIDRIADHVLGQPDFRANGNGTSQSQMTYPQYPAYDPDNDLLFVSDYSNNRVMVFDVATIVDGEDAINVLGQPDFDTTTVVLSDTGMSNPRGVAYDPTTSRLFVGSQDHHRVLVYDLGSGITNGMAASWVLGQEDFNSSGPNLDQDGIGAGNNLTLDILGQRLFVDDSPFNRVMVWDVTAITNGEDAVNVIGQEDFNSGGSDLDADSLDFSGLYGNGLAHDPDNERLFVADGSNRRIMVFDVATIDDGEDAINVLGQSDFFSEDDSLSQSSTRAAAGLAYDADNGLLYTTTKGDTGQPNADNRSSIFDVNSIVNGEPAADLLGQLDENDEPFYTTRGVDNTPNQLGFNSAHGVTVDQVNHRLFTADFNNNRVLVFNLDEDNSPIDYAADFVIGQPDFKSTASAADDPQAYNFNNGPQSVAYHEENDWLIVNDANGNRVLIFDMAALANGMDALYVLGQPDFTTHNCCTVSDSEFVSSEGIALDTETNFLYVPDGVHNRVLVFDLSTVSNGMSASFVLGQPDFTTEDANTGPDGMSSPRGAAVDAVGQRLFISDNGNRRVLVFDTSVLSNGMAATNVLGQDDFFSSENEVSQSRTPDPAGLAYDSDRNRLFVSDPNTSRVMVFDTASITDGEDAVDAYGQATFTDSGCNTTRSGLCVPQAAFYDLVNDTLYVADAANNRVLIFGPTDTGGGDDGSPPEPVGFEPLRIEVNRDDAETDSRNVLVSVYARTSSNFTGIVDVLLSNTTDFNTFVPFRYVIPEMRDGRPTRDIWPKTIAWDLCFGITETTACNLGNKVVYARFYVNVPAPMPVLVPHDVLIER